MKITREKLIGLNRAFDNLSKEKANVFFHYNLKKNKQKILEELKILDEMQKTPSPEEYIAFEKKRIAICEEACEKDENGKAVISNPNTEYAKYTFTDEGLTKVDAEVDKLREEYKEAIAEFDGNKKEFIQLLSEEIDVDFVLFSLKDMPKEVIGSDIDLLFDLIKDE